MRKLLMLLWMLVPGVSAMAQTDSPDNKLYLPGDHLNLAAVLDIFQQSKTLEAFEQAINSPDRKVNNLDLNNDGKVDYIKVADYVEGNGHMIVLRTDLNEKETQDIAVIYVEKTDTGVRLQLVGDEALYGKDYILEPATDPEGGTPNPGYKGGNTQITNNYYYTNQVDRYNTPPSYCPPVSSWVIIGYLYDPFYTPWISPWYWGYYPAWWVAWPPILWYDYYYFWYYRYTWNGWWYCRVRYFYFQPWQPRYVAVRKSAPTVSANLSAGVYAPSYAKPAADIKGPAGKPNYPDHHNFFAPQAPAAKPGPQIQQPARQERPEPPVPPSARPVEKSPGQAAPLYRPSEKPGAPVQQAPARPQREPVSPSRPSTRPEQVPAQKPPQTVGPQAPVNPTPKAPQKVQPKEAQPRQQPRQFRP